MFYWITSRIFWIPFYVLLIVLTAFKHKWKTIIIGLFIGLLLLISDQTSVQLFKNVFERLRPCHNPAIADLVHVVTNCGGQYGFVSSHATNSFALAVFSGLLLRKHYQFFLLFMLLWAAIVSYSRIYVGVHYPADIIGGAILGSVVGAIVFWLMKFMNRLLNLKIENI